MRTSILDQGVMFPGIEPRDSIEETLRLASFADRAGFERFWVAEHHNAANNCPAPEVLLAAVARETWRIRIGPGVALLPYHNPYRLAASIRLLDYLAPNRIDLALGRGQGGQYEMTSRLRQSDAEYPDQIDDLQNALGELRGGEYPDDRYAEMWLTGASLASAQLAGELSLSYCFAQFVMPTVLPQVAAKFRESSLGQMSNLPFSVAIEVLCSESQTEVDALREMVATGIPNAIVADASVELLFGYRAIVGTPKTVRPAIEYILSQYLPDEIIIISNCPDPQMRRRSFELVKGLCDDF
jgi:luciferase family oxidoreductase group 1